MDSLYREAKTSDEYVERGKDRAEFVGGGVAAAMPFLIGQIGRDDDGFHRTNRAVALSEAGVDSLDPFLRRQYLDKGAHGLVERIAFNRVQDLVPSGYTGGESSDLSRAGTGARPAGDSIRRQITVSPGAQPRRLSYEGLTEDDLGPNGQKGYIWANPDQPQYGYAVGNYSRGKVSSGSDSNPAVNFLDVDMPESKSGRFATTGEVVEGADFASNRVWGQRDYGRGRRSDGDVMFPKESIRGRSEVTAADVFTDAQRRGFDLEAGDFSRDPGKAFKELVEGYAERRGMPPVQALESIATPVPPLGRSDRFAGRLPVFEQFATAQADPESLRRSGLGTAYTASSTRNLDGLHLVSDPGEWHLQRQFEVNPRLVTPVTRAGNFLRRQSGVGLMAGIDVALNPEINQALKEGRTADAVFQGGLSVGGGVATEFAVKRGLSALANRGVTAPLQVAAQAASPLAAIQMAALAERSTPDPYAGRYQGQTVSRHQGTGGEQLRVQRQGPGNPGSVRLGEAVLNGRKVFVPYGSVAGERRVGAKKIGRPLWDLGQFFGR